MTIFGKALDIFFALGNPSGFVFYTWRNGSVVDANGVEVQNRVKRSP